MFEELALLLLGHLPAWTSEFLLQGSAPHVASVFRHTGILRQGSHLSHFYDIKDRYSALKL